jgi:uncharacterized protein
MNAVFGPTFLDTAVPMYAAGKPHRYRDACQWVLGEVALGRLQVLIDVEVLQEILHRYGALGRYVEAVSMVTRLTTLVPQVLPVTAGDM